MQLVRRFKKKRSCVMFSLKEDKNIGDAILGESALWLCRTLQPSYRFRLLDLKGRVNRNTLFFSVFFPLYVLKKFAFLLGNDTLGETISKQLFLLYLEWYARTADFIIFAGGGIIETEHYNCAFFINLITEFAERKNIPLAYNAVGFNGTFNVSYSGYQMLKKCLHSPNVISVSVRENLDEMTEAYGVSSSLVSDSAVWSADAYGVKKEDSCEPLIGVNVIRPGCFAEFGVHFSESQLLDFYIGLAHELESMGMKWQLFTNGAPKDEPFLKQLSQALNASDCQMARRPKNGTEFLRLLSRYRAVFCTRMHASICCYSLRIPTVALRWNPKQTFFYEATENSDNLFSVENADVKEVADRLKKSMTVPWNDSHYDYYRNLVMVSLKNILTLRICQ